MLDEEFVFLQQPDGQMTGGGYVLNSELLRRQMAPMTTLNDLLGGGGGGEEGEGEGGEGGGGRAKPGSVASPFEHLVVPAGLYLMPTAPSSGLGGGCSLGGSSSLGGGSSLGNGWHSLSASLPVEHVPVSDELFDRLYGLVAPSASVATAKKRRITRRSRPSPPSSASPASSTGRPKKRSTRRRR